MNSHRLDPLPVVLGGLFIAIGITYVVADLRDLEVYETVTIPVLVVGLALLAFLSTLRAVVRTVRRRITPAPAGPGWVGVPSGASGGGSGWPSDEPRRTVGEDTAPAEEPTVRVESEERRTDEEPTVSLSKQDPGDQPDRL